MAFKIQFPIYHSKDTYESLIVNSVTGVKSGDIWLIIGSIGEDELEDGSSRPYIQLVFNNMVLKNKKNNVYKVLINGYLKDSTTKTITLNFYIQ